MKFLWWGHQKDHRPPEEAVKLSLEVETAKTEAIRSDVEVSSLIGELREIRRKNNIKAAILNRKVQGTQP